MLKKVFHTKDDITDFLTTLHDKSLESCQKTMFELNAEFVRDLCNSEKDDIIYGFELGKMYSHLRDCFTQMMLLESEIRNQKVVDETKNN